MNMLSMLKRCIITGLGNTTTYRIASALVKWGLKTFPHSLKLALPQGAMAEPSPYRSIIRSDNILEELGEKYRPTKRLHNYLKYYWMHFQDVRLLVRNICEIGVETDRSLRMWEEFFPNATIYGIDINPKCMEFEGGRRRVFIGDQSDKAFLERFLAAVDGPLDIVIDDGSHVVAHQLASFEALFPRLSTHGAYVIEDVGGPVGDSALRTASALSRLVDNIMYWPEGKPCGEWPRLTTFPDNATWADRNIIGVAFYRWIIFIFRGLNPQDNPYLSQREQPGGMANLKN